MTFHPSNRMVNKPERVWCESLLAFYSMKLVIPLHSEYWSIHIKDESKRGTAFAFIFGVIDSGVVVSQHRLESFFHEIKCNGITNFMEFMH